MRLALCQIHNEALTIVTDTIRVVSGHVSDIVTNNDDISARAVVIRSSVFEL